MGIKSNASPSSTSKQKVQNNFDQDDELSQINERFEWTKLQSSEKKPTF